MNYVSHYLTLVGHGHGEAYFRYTSARQHCYDTISNFILLRPFRAFVSVLYVTYSAFATSHTIVTILVVDYASVYRLFIQLLTWPQLKADT